MIGRDWHVGMEVVFVGVPAEGWVETSSDPADPNPGEIFTIRDMWLVKRGTVLKAHNATLHLLPEDVLYIECGDEVWRASDCYRPVQKRATDISVFQRCLCAAPVQGSDRPLEVGRPIG